MSVVRRVRHAVAVMMITAGSSAVAQDSTCNAELIRSRTAVSIEVPGGFHQFLGGRVYARCRGTSTTMEADSVAWYSDRARMDFIGNVQFRDSTVTLDSDRASYYLSDERLEAFGNVRLENDETGSVLTGSRLTYLRAVPGVRDTTEIFAINRPTVEYRAEPDSAVDPYIIVADRIRLRGDAAWAGGAVTIDREGFSAQGDSSLLDTGVGEGFLIGAAQTSGRDSSSYTLVGHRIDFRLVDNSIDWIRSSDSAVATSADWELHGDTIEFHLDNDMIQYGSAWGDGTRPRAVSDQQTITADSLVIDTPNQILNEVVAIGDGHATSQGDSLGQGSDWIAGDTVVASFGDQGTGRGLHTLTARGNATSFYHIYDDSTGVGQPAINYARGRQITVRFESGELDRVDVLDGDGVYLEPPTVRRPRP